MAEETLKKQAVRGVGWSFADSMLGQGITFLVGIVLARLLTPDEYGLIGIITIFITVFNVCPFAAMLTPFLRICPQSLHLTSPVYPFAVHVGVFAPTTNVLV